MITADNVPECYRNYIEWLKKFCLQQKISFERANEELLSIIVAEEYGVKNTQEPELLKSLKSMKCDDVCEIIENAYDRRFPRCYGAYIGFCQPSPHNELCALRMQRGEYVERSLDGNT